MPKFFFQLVVLIGLFALLNRSIHQDINPNKARNPEIFEFDGIEYLHRGTATYDAKLKQLKISYEFAVEKVRHLNSTLLRNANCRHLADFHWVIAGDYFVFSEDPPKMKNHLPVSGVWICGNTGEVVVKPEYKAITFGEVPDSWKKSNRRSE